MGAINNPITFPRSPGDRERTPRFLGAKGLKSPSFRRSFLSFLTCSEGWIKHTRRPDPGCGLCIPALENVYRCCLNVKFNETVTEVWRRQEGHTGDLQWGCPNLRWSLGTKAWKLSLEFEPRMQWWKDFTLPVTLSRLMIADESRC